MRNASALSRLVAPMIAVGILVGGCGQTPSPRTAEPPARRRRFNGHLRRERSRARRGSRRTDGRRLERPRQTCPVGRPGKPAGGHHLPESCQWPRRGGGGGHRPTAVLIGDSQSEPAYLLAPESPGQPGLHRPLLRPRRHRLRRVQRQDRQLHRRPAARRLAAPLRFAAPRRHRGRRQRRFPRRNRPADFNKRRAADRQRPAALPRGAAGHGRDPGPRRRRRRGAPHRGRRAAGHCGGRAIRFPLWASGTG